MSDLSERLRRVYGANEPEDDRQSSSWIPHRMYRKGDKQGEMRSQVPEADGISPQRMEEILETEQILVQARTDIFEQVAIYLLERYGETGLEDRLQNFNTSWEDQHTKFGDDLIIALAEMTDDLTITPFVNHMGFITKKVAKEAVRKLRYRRSLQ